MGQPSKIAVPISNWSPESSVKFLYKMLLTQNRSGSNFGYVDGVLNALCMKMVRCNVIFSFIYPSSSPSSSSSPSPSSSPSYNI